jgi:uncharacterized protein
VTVGWRQRSDETFLVAMPPRGRIALEMLLVVTLVFAGGAASLSPVVAAFVVLFELALASVVVRPWSPAHGGAVSRVLTGFVVLVAVIAPVLVERPDFAGEQRRLGVRIEAGQLEAGDPPWSGGAVAVEHVDPKTPAEGVILPGDRIVAIDGAHLDPIDPTADLTTRTHSDALPEDTHVTVLRDHQLRELAVHVPRVEKPRAFGRTLGAIRDLSSRHIVLAAAMRGIVFVLLLLLVLRADGQPVRAIGISKAGLRKEILAATWMTAGAFATMIVVAIPVSAIGWATGVLERESVQRTQTIGVIASQGTIVEFILAAIFAAAFEEIAFRGFLTPRMRSVVGSWPIAVLLVSAIFGIGHIYEGLLATVQTAALGAYFAVMMLVRRNVVAPALAHAAFNSIQLVFVRLLVQGHVLEKLRSMSHH